MELPQKYQKSEIGIGFPKESPYHELMNHYILRILESGLISRNTRNTEPPSQKCDYTIGSPLGFKNCITPFQVLLGGIGLALTTDVPCCGNVIQTIHWIKSECGKPT